MAAIDHEPLEPAPPDPSAAARWSEVVQRIRDWAVAGRIELRDAVVLVPFAQLLAPARLAFGQAGSWLPRIETTQTLARSLGPPPRAQGPQLSLDAAADLLTGAQLLEAQAWGRDISRRDPRGFAHAVSSIVDTAHALWRGASAIEPSRRAAHWAQARSVLAPLSGPGATERLLARFALEWAAQGTDPATDRLFDLRPSAWVIVQAGGSDPLASALMQAAPAGVACLLIDTDVPPPRLSPEQGLATPPSLAVCDGFEHEAQCAAAQVLDHLQRGEQPVALIAQDRVLVRRVRALLEQSGATLLDETGWTLSTTRAAAQVMALLRAAGEGAGTDTLFDWLKGIETWPGVSDVSRRIGALEAACRRHQIARIDALGRLDLEPHNATFRAQVLDVLRRLAPAPGLGVADWLARLEDALGACGLASALLGDDAGRQVLAALHLDDPRASWREARGGQTLDAPGFTAWVDAVFERASFRPSHRTPAPQVVITPLAQAILRPFAAVVLPGADDTQLGAMPSPHPLLGEALLRELGLPDADQRRGDEAAAFAHLLAAAPLTLLRRRVDDDEPRADSMLVERLRLELQRRGSDLVAWHDPRTVAAIEPLRLSRPAPPAPMLLPAQVTASAAEALRACPYRYFALYLLGLDEVQELDAEVEKRDYGNWLHDVLERFHAERGTPGPRDEEMRRLAELGRTVQVERGIDDAEFLPFAASFEVFVPRYVDWLHERDARGVAWRESETEIVRPLPETTGIALRGRLDRIDVVPGVAGQSLELIDYKTGGTQSLEDKVKQPFEDTQLAFYAALVAPEGRPLKAIYLALDSTKEIKAIEHKRVEASAEALLQGLDDDLRRLQAGAGLPALGEGVACDYCAARGLCRRDHWSHEVAS